jgi:hypothetical protein
VPRACVRRVYAPALYPLTNDVPCNRDRDCDKDRAWAWKFARPTLSQSPSGENTAARSTYSSRSSPARPRAIPGGAAMSAGNQKFASQTYICGSAAVIGTQTHDECMTELSLERKHNLSSGVWQWNAITTTRVSTTSRSLGWSRIVCTEQRLHQLPEARQ